MLARALQLLWRAVNRQAGPPRTPSTLRSSQGPSPAVGRPRDSRRPNVHTVLLSSYHYAHTPILAGSNDVWSRRLYARTEDSGTESRVLYQYEQRYEVDMHMFRNHPHWLCARTYMQ